MQVKMFVLQDQSGETSDIIVDYLHQVLTDNNLIEKVVRFRLQTNERKNILINFVIFMRFELKISIIVGLKLK